jgi:hypothetical protein
LFLSYCQAALEIKKPIIVFDFGGVIAEVDTKAVPSYIQKTLHISATDVEKMLHALRESRTKQS